MPDRIVALKFLDRWLGTTLVRFLPPPRVLPPPAAPRSILIIRPGGIGDAVLLVPTVHYLQKHFPQSSIDILVEQRNAGAFTLCSGLRRVYHYDRPSLLLRLLFNHYDVVIDTEQWYRLSAVIGRLVRAPLKIGYATNERRRLFTHPVHYDLEDYEVNSFLRLLQPLGIGPGDSIEPPWLKVPETAKSAIAKLLPVGDPAPLVVIFPGASIPEKCWGDNHFREVVRWCAERTLKVVLIGGTGEKEIAGRIAAVGAISLVGMTSLAETAAILERAAVVVSGDSGILHIAAGLGRSTVSLFGPSSSAKWGPRGDQHVVLRPSECPACSRYGTTPPCPQNVRCMQEISVENVTSAIRTLLPTHLTTD